MILGGICKEVLFIMVKWGMEKKVEIRYVFLIEQLYIVFNENLVNLIFR